jgi:hypothetical protein
VFFFLLQANLNRQNIEQATFFLTVDMYLFHHDTSFAQTIEVQVDQVGISRKSLPGFAKTCITATQMITIATLS